MKIFNKKENFADKVNFADKNGVLLGYDLSQDCCEEADWFINDKPLEKVEYDKNYNKLTPMENYYGDELEDYVFDTKYFKSISDSDWLDAGEMVIFRITNGVDEKFIHIFNAHNGYYGHGFEFKEGNEILKEGSL